MSGHCDFCNIWHSGSCCHPGRALLTVAEARISSLEDAVQDVIADPASHGLAKWTMTKLQSVRGEAVAQFINPEPLLQRITELETQKAGLLEACLAGALLLARRLRRVIKLGGLRSTHVHVALEEGSIRDAEAGR